MKLILSLVLLSSLSFASEYMNCLSSGAKGPQDGADLNACSKVLIPGSERAINCLSDKLDGPQDGEDINLCSNVTLQNNRVVNCFEADFSCPEDDKEAFMACLDLVVPNTGEYVNCLGATEEFSSAELKACQKVKRL